MDRFACDCGEDLFYISWTEGGVVAICADEECGQETRLTGKPFNIQVQAEQ